jgi:hypothetical protein
MVEIDAEAASEGKLGEVLRGWIQFAGRGASATLARSTTLTESDISNWLAGRRQLPDWKLNDAVEWLLRSNRVSINYHHQEGP